jgi:hypothetical protein
MVFMTKTLFVLREVGTELLNIGQSKGSVPLTNDPHTIDDLKMAITEYIRNVDRAKLNTVFENTVRRVSKYLGSGDVQHRAPLQ